MKWFRIGMFDAGNESWPVMLAGDPWPAIPSALRLAKTICEVAGRETARQPESSVAVSIFEVTPPNEAEQLRIFELLGERSLWDSLRAGIPLGQLIGDDEASRVRSVFSETQGDTKFMHDPLPFVRRCAELLEAIEDAAASEAKTGGGEST